MVTPEVTGVWEFYRDNCPGFKEPMREQLRKVDSHMAELESQNDKLREQLEYDRQTSRSRAELIDRLKAENESLRELVRDIWDAYRCEEVAPNVAKHWHDRMRELGVEP